MKLKQKELAFQILENVGGKICNNDISPSSAHTGENLHESGLQVEGSSLGSMVQHGILSRYLQLNNNGWSFLIIFSEAASKHKNVN